MITISLYLSKKCYIRKASNFKDVQLLRFNIYSFQMYINAYRGGPLWHRIQYVTVIRDIINAYRSGLLWHQIIYVTVFRGISNTYRGDTDIDIPLKTVNSNFGVVLPPLLISSMGLSQVLFTIKSSVLSFQEIAYLRNSLSSYKIC